MIQIKNLTITHQKDLKVLVDDLNITLNNGDKLAIIGEEGNGKSTLLKLIYDPSLVSLYTEYSGSVITKDKKAYLAQEMSKDDLAKTIYEYFQFDEFFDSTYEEQLALTSRFDLASDIFYSSQVINTLSGGERVKLQLMKLLLTKANILLLDEPSNDLDIKTLEILEKTIKEFKGIIIYVSHDETLLKNTANMICHLEQLRRKSVSKVTVTRSSYSDYIKNRYNAIKRQNELALKDEREKKIRDAKYSKVYQSVNDAQNACKNDAEGKNLKDKMHAVKSMGRRFEKLDLEMTKRAEFEEKINLKLDPKVLGMPDNKIILDYHLSQLIVDNKLLASDIDLFIRGNVKLAIIGNNGVGKSSLLKRIYSELKNRTDLTVGYMPQNYEDLLNLKINPVEYLSRDTTKENLTKTRTMLGSLKFTVNEMNHAIADLSGGQKAKVLLIKLILDNSNVLILDEPTRNFSPLSSPVIRDLLISFPGTIISVSHDRVYLDEVVNEIYQLESTGLVKIR